MKQIPKRVLAIGLSAALLVPGGALAAAGGDPALSRSAFARVLWEEAGRPSAPAGEFFSDVAPGDANYTAILCAPSRHRRRQRQGPVPAPDAGHPGTGPRSC